MPKAKDKKRLVLLDSHAILHRAYHALPDFASPKGEPTGALYGLVAMLLKLIEDLKPDFIVACFDLPDPTYRHEAFEGYKATRTKTDDALVAQLIRSRDIFEAFGIPVYDRPGFEADDMLGTIVEETKKAKDLEIIIASGDMDTLQLVEKNRVKVYTLRKGIKDTILYDEAGVRGRFGFGPELIPDYKGLRGDPSDNIPGVVGVGEKTAMELISKFGPLEEIYKKLKKDEKELIAAGIKKRMVDLLRENEEEAQFSKMLATIRRDAPIDFVLPTVSWRDAIDHEKLLSLFSEFGFRALAVRVKSFLGEGGGEQKEEKEASDSVPQRELEEASLALWLLESDITNPTLEDVLEYGKSEGQTSSFPEAAAFIKKRLCERGLERIFTEIELPLRDVLEEIKTRGILLNVPYLKDLSKVFHKELSALESRIYEHAGVVFNINSPKQLGEVLFDTLALGGKNQKRTATGQRSTKESELEKMRGTHPIIEDILRYRELQKLVSTYVDSLPEMIGEDGRVHSTLLQAGTTTGRMSSQNPNLQNIPVRTEEGKKIRCAFIASPGMKLISIDYSQIELRIAAMLSGDEKLSEIFKKGDDVHRAVAAQVFRVPEGEVTSEMRRRAKVINFGILYGMGVNALKQNLGEDTTRAEAQEFLTAYFHTFTRLAEYLEDTKAAARKNGYTETYFGRRRHFPGLRSPIPFIKAAAERMAINAPIQGTQADLIRIAMVRIGAYIKDKKLTEKVHMLLQVHDELLFEVAEKEVETICGELRKIMEGVLTLKETNGVPIKTETAVGDNWGELERI